MNERDFNASAAQVALRQLPEFTPDAGLWPRVLARQLRSRRVQRVNRGAFAAVALLFACAAIMWLPHPVLSLQQQIVAGQHESSALEDQWQRIARSAPSVTASLTRVHMIDADLQAAYDHGAGLEDIATLWRQRNEVLRGLVARKHGANTHVTASVTRI